MWLRLAAMWGCTLKEAAAKCDAAEFALWSALYEIDPWGEERADLRSAQITAKMHNAFFSNKREISEFMFFQPDKPKPTPKQIFDKAQQVIGMFNGSSRQS